MKQAKVFFFLLLLIAVIANAQVKRVSEKGNLRLENIPEIPERIQDNVARYGNIRSASFRGWLPEEGILMATTFGETRQIHRLKKAGAMREQITFFQEPIRSVAISPNKEVNGFLFLKDVGGSENYQVFFQNLKNGKSRLLSDGKSRYESILWANDGINFVCCSTQRNGKDWDLCIGNIQTGELTIIKENNGAWMPVDWSPDDKKILVKEYVSINQSNYYVLDLETKKYQKVFFEAGDEKVAYGIAKWSQDGKGIYFTTDYRSEFLQLHYYDISMNTTGKVSGYLSWNVKNFELSPDGRWLVFIVNEDGVSKGYCRDLQKNTTQQLDIPFGIVYGLEFHQDSNLLAMVINRPDSPADIYVHQMDSGKLEKWTYSETGGIDTSIFSVPEIIRYPTFDKVDGKVRTIPAFYYHPKGVEGKVPVLISIHGGPEGQHRPYFNPTIQYYINELKVAVIAPNVRGSNGYGKTYLQLDNGFKREDSVKDIGALLDWIEGQEQLDSKRVMVQGGSYGGYMVLASLIHYNDRLSGGIDSVGISNFVTFLLNTKDYRRDLRRAEYGDERDSKMREFLLKISPTTNAHKITKPILIVQGQNDPRVPLSESEQMVEIIRKNGGEVWYLMAKDEGHGFRKKTNRNFYRYTSVLFMEQYLLQNSED